jgi:hypothetical protein
LRQAGGLFCTTRSTKRQVLTFGWRGRTHIAGIDNRLCKSSERLLTEALRHDGIIFPSWLPVLTEVGFEPVLILLRSDACLEEVETFVGNKCVIWCGSDWGAFGTAVPNFSGRDCQGFVDGRVTGEAMSLFTSMCVTQVAGTRRARRGFAGWKATEIQVAHNNVGGVTTQKEQL